MTIEITVASVGRTGQKTTPIKDTTGKYWQVWNDKINDFQPGVMVHINTYDTYTSPQTGRTSYTIKTYHIAATSARPSTIPATVRSPTQNDQERRMDIFICGAINNTLSNPNVNPIDLQMMDIIDQLHKFKSAWLAVFGPNPLPKRNDPISTTQGQAGSLPHNDMDDDIPFAPEFR